MPILEAIHVTKDFREGREVVHVLKGVTVGVDCGEVVALEGPSGSGKTTLLSILGCILTASSGHVVINGQCIDARHIQHLPAVRKRAIGFVFQQYNLFPALTATENVEYALNIKGISGRAARKEAQRVIKQVGLEQRRRALPRDLSGGQKQRVAIARALAGSSPILLADEPTANLDSETGQEILTLFRHLAKEENRALLIVTHDPKVRAISDRILRIRDGQISQAPEVIIQAA
jgi:putative ABC transport system ATP-binding protein